MAEHTKPIAESNRFIVLDKYAPEWKVAEGYQSEGDLEREFIQDLQNQGYEYLPGLNTPGSRQPLLPTACLWLPARSLSDYAWHPCRRSSSLT